MIVNIILLGNEILTTNDNTFVKLIKDSVRFWTRYMYMLSCRDHPDKLFIHFLIMQNYSGIITRVLCFFLSMSEFVGL